MRNKTILVVGMPFLAGTLACALLLPRGDQTQKTPTLVSGYESGHPILLMSGQLPLVQSRAH